IWSSANSSGVRTSMISSKSSRRSRDTQSSFKANNALSISWPIMARCDCVTDKPREGAARPSLSQLERVDSSVAGHVKPVVRDQDGHKVTQTLHAIVGAATTEDGLACIGSEPVQPVIALRTGYPDDALRAAAARGRDGAAAAVHLRAPRHAHPAARGRA